MTNPQINEAGQGSAGAKRPAARILAAMGREAWAITPGALEMMVDIAARELSAPSAVLREGGAPLEGAGRSTQMREGVAVIAIRGPIFRHATMFDAICGATSVESLARDFAAAVDDQTVRGIVLDIDSPGGQVTGINEFAAQIAAARAVKPVVAYAGGMAASAAYWLASAAGEIVADRTAELGSIGVVATYTDTAKQDEMLGIKRMEIVSSQSPNKRLSPTTKEGKAAVQILVDGLADVFVETVAANRGRETADVLENFGQGGVMLAGAAVAVGMADRLGSLEGVISEIAAKASGGHRPALGLQAKGAKMPESENVLTAEAVDAAWLAANKPGLVAAISADAAKVERERIAAIQALEIKGHDALLNKAMFVEPMGAEGVALAVLQDEKATRAAVKADMEQDATEATVPPSAAPGADEAEAALKTATASAIAAGMNQGRV